MSTLEIQANQEVKYFLCLFSYFIAFDRSFLKEKMKDMADNYDESQFQDDEIKEKFEKRFSKSLPLDSVNIILFN